MTIDESGFGDFDPMTDPELIALVRSGDLRAYEVLFSRHRYVALRLARRLAGPERADDISSEAFAKILELLKRGKGPDHAFRSYLLATVRTVHINQIRAGTRESSVADAELQSLAAPVSDDPDARFDQDAIARAFRQLPERWKSALWMTAVEGRSHDEVGRILGIQANAVASLAFRARAGLRHAFLAEHLAGASDGICVRVVALLPNYLRGTLSTRRRSVVERHLQTCLRCATATEELEDVDRRLGALLAPLLLAGPDVGRGLWSRVSGDTAAKVAVAGVALVAVAASTLLFASAGPDRGAKRTSAPGVAPASVTATGTIVVPPSISPVPAVSQVPSQRPAIVPPAPAVPGTRRATASPKPTQHVEIRPLHAEYLDHDDTTWVRVSASVVGAAPGTRLLLASTNAVEAVIGSVPGWACDPPVLGFTTSIECTFSGGGEASPVRVDYRLGSPATIRATVSAPAGSVDDSPADNITELLLG